MYDVSNVCSMLNVFMNMEQERCICLCMYMCVTWQRFNDVLSSQRQDSSVLCINQVWVSTRKYLRQVILYREKFYVAHGFWALKPIIRELHDLASCKCGTDVKNTCRRKRHILNWSRKGFTTFQQYHSGDQIINTWSFGGPINIRQQDSCVYVKFTVAC
jgi:hypothetical protein